MPKTLIWLVTLPRLSTQYQRARQGMGALLRNSSGTAMKMMPDVARPTERPHVQVLSLSEPNYREPRNHVISSSLLPGPVDIALVRTTGRANLAILP
jgi:hypothetical protein